ncbi:MAG: hypothetical protein HYS12_14820 [Planctomycetes bacterium]|nr:hypothetical protein [Planctomycetota bacterium]
MLRVGTSGLCVALVVVGLASADSKPAVTELRNQIKALRKEEGAILKAIKSRYEAIIRRDRLTEKELRHERAEITSHEDQALALATSSTEREQIRKVYDALRQYLTKAVRLEEREIRLLRDHERAHVKHVKALYAARIRHLEQEIRMLERKPGKKR